jgi:hypothetical protein
MKNASLLLLATLVACSESVSPTPVSTPTPEPVVIEIEVAPPTAPVAKFKVGDAVDLEGMPANLTAKVLQVLGMQLWTNNETNEEVQLMSYLVEVTGGAQTQIMPVPELYMTAK